MQSINQVKKETGAEKQASLGQFHKYKKLVSLVFLMSLFSMLLGQMLASALSSSLVKMKNLMGFKKWFQFFR